MKEPRQWVYIIERKANEVKVGASINPNQRIADIQRIGGFEIIRTEILGPFQNGYKVETEIHHRLHTHQIVSEWFLIPFEQAVLIAKEVAEKIGDRNIVQDSIEVD